MKPLSQLLNKINYSLIFIFTLCYATLAKADLPTPLGGDGVPDGDFLGQVESWTDRALELGGLVVSAISFLVFAVMLIGESYKQYQSNNPEYSRVGFLAILAGITLIGTTYLLNQSSGIVIA